MKKNIESSLDKANLLCKAFPTDDTLCPKCEYPRWSHYVRFFEKKPARVYCYHPLKKTIQISWSVEDVESVRPDLTLREQMLVLRALKMQHDAELGINWAVIEATAIALYPIWIDKYGDLVQDIPEQAIADCTAPGRDAEPYVKEWIAKLKFRAGSRDQVVGHLREYGAWDDLETATMETLTERAFWTVCSNLNEHNVPIYFPSHPD